MAAMMTMMAAVVELVTMLSLAVVVAVVMRPRPSRTGRMRREMPGPG
jgi:hypothetical protein